MYLPSVIEADFIIAHIFEQLVTRVFVYPITIEEKLVSLKKIMNLALKRFGPKMEFKCEYVDHIPQEPGGKYRFCISRVRNPFS